MLAQESRAALAALSFLTRVPVAVQLDGEDVRRAGAYFPLIGAALGGVTGAVTRRWGAPVGLVAETVLTGALHLDALADSADALGTRDRARALEIMRDSRIGSFGAAALCLDLMVRAAALSEAQAPVRAAVSAGTLSRAVPVLLSAALPYARPDGTGAALSSGSGTRAAVAAGLAAAISRDVGAMVVAGGLTLTCAGFWRRKFGGVTGDTLGASVELAEVAVLVWCTR